MFKFFLSGLLLSATAAISQNAAELIQKTPIAKVWAGHPVGFDFKLHKGRFYIAYYDDQRRMTVATSPVEKLEWTYQILPSNVTWDSHNYITMTMASGKTVPVLKKASVLCTNSIYGIEPA